MKVTDGLQWLRTDADPGAKFDPQADNPDYPPDPSDDDFMDGWGKTGRACPDCDSAGRSCPYDDTTEYQRTDDDDDADDCPEDDPDYPDCPEQDVRGTIGDWERRPLDDQG
jgi:hypothetical protein